MLNKDREPILDWSVSKSERLPVSWNYLYSSYVLSHILSQDKFKITYRTPEETLAQIPSNLYETAWLVRYSTAFGLPYIRAENESGVQASTREIYAEPVLDRHVEPARLRGYSIGVRSAQWPNEIARVENEVVSFGWRLDSGITGEYPVDNGRQSLNYLIEPEEHRLSMRLNRQEGGRGSRISGINVILRGDGLDNPYIEVGYGETDQDSSLMHFKFDKEGKLTQAQLKVEEVNSKWQFVSDPRAGDRYIIDPSKHNLSPFADLIYGGLGILERSSNLPPRIDPAASIKQVINRFIGGFQEPLRNWLVFQ